MASALTLGGVLPADEPTWYVLYQALLGLLQSAIALFMMAGYRRAGTWGVLKCHPWFWDRPRGARAVCLFAPLPPR